MLSMLNELDGYECHISLFPCMCHTRGQLADVFFQFKNDGIVCIYKGSYFIQAQTEIHILQL